MIQSGEFQEKLKNCTHYSEVLALTKEMVAPILQTLLDAEMTSHLGYEKYEHRPKGMLREEGSENMRNGRGKKTLRTSQGMIEVEMPRDRAGTFTPQVVEKRGTSLDPSMEDRIISMYAKGLSLSDMKDYLQEIYGITISETFLSTVTNQVLDEVRQWQERPLATCYVVVFLDAIHYKVRSEGKIVTKACYTMLGITEEGTKELIGIWIGEAEGARYWLRVLNELKQRGVEDMLIACMDGLSGLVEAVQATFPKTEVQRCIVHQIRATLKYIPHKEKRAVIQDLKGIYQAVTEQEGRQRLEEVRIKWKKYAHAFTSWERYWPELSAFFAYSAEIRTMMYTTNTIENIHRQFRKVTKNAVIFPNDTALLKRLYLAQRDMTKRWTGKITHWNTIMNELKLFFPERFLS